MTVRPPLLALLGSTASGKSDLAMALARRAGAQILSLDSMQVYVGMDVGTAKPSVTERTEVKHHMIDVVQADETFTVARFVDLADQVIAGAAATNTPLVATGGTPLYYKALFEGLFEGPSADAAVRAALDEQASETLASRLAAVDPQAAARIHANDRRRLIRALEVYELTGRPISSFQTDWDAPVFRHPIIWVGLIWEKEALNRRINARVKAMMAAGWLEETRRLYERHGRLSQTAAEATGYRQLADHLAGRISLDQATEAIKIATRQLARRQMKWFRRFEDVLWLPGDRPLEENVAAVLSRWPAPG